MMEFPVVHDGRPVGSCTIREEGLYWVLECSCMPVSDSVERIYSGFRRLGVLERRGDQLHCRRKLSKSSVPELPPRSGVFSLSPMADHAPWEGSLLGHPCKGFREGETLLFPYMPDQPCPCEPLICFFEIRDGFWRLPMRAEWLNEKTDGC